MQIDPAKLIDARLARAMSQEEAAIAADLSARTIQRIEAGHPASLESTKALLTVYGAEIIHDPAEQIATVHQSPWPTTKSKIGQATRLSASLGFDGMRALFAALFIFLAAAKPFAPAQTGLFVREDNYLLGLVDRAPAGSHELLGYWLMPLMILAGLALVISIGRVRSHILK